MQSEIIGGVRIYTGRGHPGITGERVVIIAVHRGARPDESTILRDDESIGELLPDDLVEFAPLIRENGGERPSWVTSDATPDELAPE